MDKLLNISREGGYPLDAESLKILSTESMDAIVAIMEGLVRNRRLIFVFLTYRVDHNGWLIDGIGYRKLMPGQVGEVLRYKVAAGQQYQFGSLTAGLEHCCVDVHWQDYDATNIHGTFPAVRQTRQAVITLNDDANQDFRFYTLKDILNRKKTYAPSDLVMRCYSALPILPWDYPYNEHFVGNGFILSNDANRVYYNNDMLHVDLHIMCTMSMSNGQEYFVVIELPNNISLKINYYHIPYFSNVSVNSYIRTSPLNMYAIKAHNIIVGGPFNSNNPDAYISTSIPASLNED